MEAKKPTIGIIGCLGKYGKWLCQFFSGRGYAVTGSDKGFDENARVLRDAEVSIFATPIESTSRIIREEVRMARDFNTGSEHQSRLWIDIASVKTEPMKALLEATKIPGTTIEVAGLHPMCAPPRAGTWKGQTVIVCPVHLAKWQDWLFDNFLQESEASVKIMMPEDHDKAMAAVQALPHAVIIAMARTFKELGLDIKELNDVASPFYKIIFALMGRIANQDPHLYKGIQAAHFGEGAPSRDVLRMFANQLVEVTTHPNVKAQMEKMVGVLPKNTFVEKFLETREHFGETGKEGFELFEKLIRSMTSE